MGSAYWNALCQPGWSLWLWLRPAPSHQQSEQCLTTLHSVINHSMHHLMARRARSFAYAEIMLQTGDILEEMGYDQIGRLPPHASLSTLLQQSRPWNSANHCPSPFLEIVRLCASCSSASWGSMLQWSTCTHEVHHHDAIKVLCCQATRDIFERPEASILRHQTRPAQRIRSQVCMTPLHPVTDLMRLLSPDI